MVLPTATDVSFVRASYTFSEGDRTGNIEVILRGTLATQVTATVFEIDGQAKISTANTLTIFVMCIMQVHSLGW